MTANAPGGARATREQSLQEMWKELLFGQTHENAQCIRLEEEKKWTG